MNQLTEMKIQKRNGEIVIFNPEKIRIAISKAIRASKVEVDELKINQIISEIIDEVQNKFIEFHPNVENIQDLVEKKLMRMELYEVAKSYILYREERRKEREKEKQEIVEKAQLGKLRIKNLDGSFSQFDIKYIRNRIKIAAIEYQNEISIDLIAKEVIRSIYDGVSIEEINKAIVMSTSSFIEKDPAYSLVAGKLFLANLFTEVTGEDYFDNTEIDQSYKSSLMYAIQKGVEDKVLDRRMLSFDLDRLSKNIKPERDNLFQYMGLQTLYERYLLKVNKKRVELPQIFWMRVAMGLAINEKEKNQRAIEFYELLSSMRFVSSTPTLFHSGTTHPQLSSCYLNTVGDDLSQIFKVYGDNAQLSKWSGGIGTDWTNVRATGSIIKSNRVESQGVIPFLKIANDVTVAINRSGKRRGAACVYLETWHLDIEDFLDLKKNTGDERRRTHDMNTANWIPDLFMKRVISDGDWTLFSPEEVSDLHHSYGRNFEQKYVKYEKMALEGLIKKFKIIPARKLWKKMLGMLFETGHPWITFKDPCNIRSPQDHCGVVHNSNLCTEITLNTSEEETAVCNLGSINLGKHIKNGRVDRSLIENTVRLAVRMLDNVIDINFYPTTEARNSNLKHRPIGLGLMGFQDALYLLDINFDSDEAVDFADKSMELISYYAILSSSELAEERGVYESFKGSKWDRGLFPLDTLKLLEEERGIEIPINKESMLDWTSLKIRIKETGLRNSNIMAIAPTATISTISGCYPCIEPIFKNIYVKSNMTGEFTVVNPYLIEDLKKLNLWNQDILDQLKYYDGNISMIAGIPEKIKNKYKEVFDIDPMVLIKITAVRGKWIDQSQSFNVFMKGVSGNKLNEIYTYAWQMGLKTTYYLRTLAASQIEKSTLDANKFGFTQKRQYEDLSVNEEKITTDISNVKVCSILDPECEACQ